MSSQSPFPEPPPPRLAFSLNLALAMAAGTIGGAALAAVSPVLVRDLGISSAQLGWGTAAYLAAGAIFSPSLGRYIAGVGSRRVLYVLLIYAAVSFVVVALSPTFTVLLVGMFVAGIAGALSNPVTNQAIAETYPPGQRGTVIGIKQSGVQMGVFLAGVTLPTLAVATDWRWAIASLALIPSVGIVMTGRLVPRSARAPSIAAARSGVRRRSLLRNYPVLRWLAVYATFMGAGGSSLTTYLPLYAFDELGFSAPLAGLAASLVGLTGIIARLVVGRAIETRTVRVYVDLTIIAVGSAAFATLILLAPRVGPWALWAGVAGIGGVTMTWNVIVTMILIRDLPTHHSAAATGIVLTGFYVGLLAGPILFGTILAHFGYSGSWSGVAGGFVVAALVMLSWGLRSRAATRR